MQDRDLSCIISPHAMTPAEMRLVGWLVVDNRFRAICHPGHSGTYNIVEIEGHSAVRDSFVPTKHLI